MWSHSSWHLDVLQNRDKTISFLIFHINTIIFSIFIYSSVYPRRVLHTSFPCHSQLDVHGNRSCVIVVRIESSSSSFHRDGAITLFVHIMFFVLVWNLTLFRKFVSPVNTAVCQEISDRTVGRRRLVHSKSSSFPTKLFSHPSVFLLFPLLFSHNAVALSMNIFSSICDLIYS